MFNQTTSLPTDRGFYDADTGNLLSLADLRRQSTFVSEGLTLLHAISPHQTVAIVARNCITYPLALLSASRIGAAVTCLPNEAQPDDLAYYFKASNTVFVFADATTVDRVKQACESVGIRGDKVVRLDDGAGDREAMTIGDLAAEGKQMEVEGQSVVPWTPEKPADQICGFLNFSSGTTGRPKAVCGSLLKDRLRLANTSTRFEYHIPT